MLIVASFPRRADLETQVRKNNPVDAVDFIRHCRLSGPMLNVYLWGGYLTWVLPKHKVFIDGRTDIFAWTYLPGWRRIYADDSSVIFARDNDTAFWGDAASSSLTANIPIQASTAKIHGSGSSLP